MLHEALYAFGYAQLYLHIRYTVLRTRRQLRRRCATINSEEFNTVHSNWLGLFLQFQVATMRPWNRAEHNFNTWHIHTYTIAINMFLPYGDEGTAMIGAVYHQYSGNNSNNSGSNVNSIKPVVYYNSGCGPANGLQPMDATTKGLLNRPGQNNCFLNCAVQVSRTNVRLFHL